MSINFAGFANEIDFDLQNQDNFKNVIFKSRSQKYDHEDQNCAQFCL